MAPPTQVQLDRVRELVDKINEDSQRLTSGDVKLRKSLIESARHLYQALETPEESFLRLMMLDNTTKALMRVGFDLHLFQHFSPDKDQAIGSAELADKTGAERILIARMLKHFAAAGLVVEAGPDTYYANGQTKMLAEQKAEDGFKYFKLVIDPTLNVLPEYLAKNGYRDPKDGLNTAMQMAFGTRLHAFDYVKQDPELARVFKVSVLSLDHHRARWAEPEFYPVKERLLSGLKQDDSSAVLVDVGGGIGLDLTAFHNAHPEPAGSRLILQDQQGVLQVTQNLPSRIEKMEHDFFTEQPVKGARAYYFHRCFHDWTDEKCREMLLAIKPALVPGYSKVLVQDQVIPSQGAHWMTTCPDLLMLMAFAGRERSEEDFKALFESVGMKVTGIWTRAPGEESIVEAVILE